MKRYRNVKRPGTRETIGEHRLVFEEAYGPIPDGCVVHHRNGNPRDNRLVNLELMTHQQHSAHHNQKHPKEKKCVICERTFTPPPTKRSRQQTCSPECRLHLLSIRAYERYGGNAERDESIRELFAVGVSNKRLSEIFGLSRPSITRITKS